MVPFNQYQQQMRWESLLPISNLVFTIIIIIVICNMLIVSSIDAYYFFLFFIFFLFCITKVLVLFSLFVSPNFWVLFFANLWWFYPQYLGFHHNFIIFLSMNKYWLFAFFNFAQFNKVHKCLSHSFRFIIVGT